MSVNDIIGTPNLGPLFAEAAASAALDAGAGEGARTVLRPRVHATVSGGSALARERVAPKVGGMRARVLAIYTAIGPATRNQCAAVLCGQDPPTPEAMNTVQGRTHELLASKALRVTGHERAHGRGLLEAVPTENSGNP